MHYRALDGWRGLCAWFVALLHTPFGGHVVELPFVRNASLYVDFFFVLSGFFIAANYQERISGGFPVWRFMVLRFGRLYPLHLAMLMLFIVAQGARVALLPGSPHYVGPVPTAEAFLANLLMVQWISLDAYGVWNHPSWTIGVEFYTYLLFALAIVVLRTSAGLVALLALLIGVPVLGWIHGYHAVYDLYLLRGVYGFAWGVAAWNLHYRLPRQSFSTSWEIVAAAAVIAFTSVAGGTGWVLAGPAVFALATFVFSSETGAVSRVLCSRPLLLCGLCSYSIYMTHAFVARVMLRLAEGHGRSISWLGDALLLPYAACVLLMSVAAFKYIEQPSRDLVRARINKKAVAT